jgi:hypothetical protein
MWAKTFAPGMHPPKEELAAPSRVYTHVIADEAEVDYAALVAAG